MHSSPICADFVMLCHYFNKANDIFRDFKGDFKDDFIWVDLESSFFRRKPAAVRSPDLLASLEEIGEMVKGQDRVKVFQSLKGTLKRILIFMKEYASPCAGKIQISWRPSQ